MDLSKLNEMQRLAVVTTEGPLLVMAGAGSGKTRVLTHRIAYLLEEKQVFPSKILAITFTNKAAKEMKNRVHNLVGDVAEGMWIGTFHSICVRILRRHADEIGYSSDFVIYDTSDQKTLVKQCMKELDINDKQTTDRSIIAKISDAKNVMIGPAEFEKQNSGDFSYNAAIKVYHLYQTKLKANNAMDFDDLILKAIEILQVSPAAIEYYQTRFRYVLVDEYQDTNKAQYILIKTISDLHKNLCVVGDLDQSIYGWRGADIRNINDFENDFADGKTIKLERNYRSSEVILNAANAVIKNNTMRKEKRLWTDNTSGEPLSYYQASNEYDEAGFVASKISNGFDRGINYNENAILYRTNAQSRVFEDAFRKLKIPYKIYGGLKFYDRKEIKDLLGYLRVILNQQDEISLLRVINVPKRGIGAKTIERLQELRDEDDTLYDAISVAIERQEFSTKINNNLNEFLDIIEKHKAKMFDTGVTKLLESVLDYTKYLKLLREENTIESQSRIDNIKELVSATAEFERSAETGYLDEFLAVTSLQSDIDGMEEDYNTVAMMTLHSAKGLEFPHVFLVGVEESIFPSFRSIEDPMALEEERRLAYVGITRAEETLCISHAASRTMFGKTQVNQVSRFIGEIPKDCFGDVEVAQKRKKISFGLTMDMIKDKAKSESKIETKAIGNTDKSALKAGTKVRHKVFGNGMIISKSGDVLTIAFENKGIKKLQIDFAPLEVIL
ncbi:MAG: UvrD-helicase domain-containing protein [Clostridiales bacterium]|nr:UvrD-helicase domain-containing protein [Clostridiales bacterium]